MGSAQRLARGNSLVALHLAYTTCTTPSAAVAYKPVQNFNDFLASRHGLVRQHVTDVLSRFHREMRPWLRPSCSAHLSNFHLPFSYPQALTDSANHSRPSFPTLNPLHLPAPRLSSTSARHGNPRRHGPVGDARRALPRDQELPHEGRGSAEAGSGGRSRACGAVRAVRGRGNWSDACAGIWASRAAAVWRLLCAGAGARCSVRGVRCGAVWETIVFHKV